MILRIDGRDLPRITNLVLPCGTELHDAFVWVRFCQEELGLDPDSLWRDLLSLPTRASDESIPFRVRGDDPHWVPGDHPALHYRGNTIPRDKIWCQSEYDQGYRRYSYPGWQYAIAYAAHDVQHVPPLQLFASAFNDFQRRNGQPEHNHLIATRYKGGHDTIGFHSDRADDFAEDSYVVVVKLGAQRPFEVRLKRPKGEPEDRPFFSRVLPPGTAVFMRANAPDGDDANARVEHSVPRMSGPVGCSGSIVSRRIATVMPWEQVHHKVRESERRKKR